MFSSVFGWLSAHLDFWPSIVLAVVGFLWSALWIPALDDNEDAIAGVGVGFFAMIGFLVGSWSSGAWAYWLPYLAGAAILPTIFGACSAYDAVSEWVKKARIAEEALRVQRAEEAKKRKTEYAKSPAGVIARCEAVVKRYIDALPQDLLVIEERRQAETKLDALRELYKLLETIEKLGPDDEDSFNKRLAEDDALFSDVSLKDECAPLVRALRERSVKKAPPILGIHLAIEALVFSINALPGKAAARIATEVPSEYRTSSDDLAAEIGRPVLPVIDMSPEPDAPVRPIRAPRKQTA